MGATGAKGSFEAGATASLIETRQFDTIYGVSAGALNAMIAAQYMPARLRFAWLELGDIIKHTHRLRLKDLRPLIERYADSKALTSRLVIPLLEVASKTIHLFSDDSFISKGTRSKGNSVQFERKLITQDNMVDVVLASFATAGLFAPVSIKSGENISAKYSSGARGFTSPIGYAATEGATEVVAVFTDGRPAAPSRSSWSSAKIRKLKSEEDAYQGNLYRDLLETTVLERDSRIDTLVSAPKVETVTPTTELPDLADFEHETDLARGFDDGRIAGQKLGDAFTVVREYQTWQSKVGAPSFRLGGQRIIAPIDLESQIQLEQPAPKLDLSRPWEVREIFYATDRKLNLSKRGVITFGADRSDGGLLYFGRCLVSIPQDHQMGNVERPKWYRLEFRSDKAKHFVIVATLVETEDNFVAGITGAMSDDGSERTALVFIHGFNTSFVDAIYRTAQLGYDLEYKGPLISYSWPSQARLTAYPIDRSNIDWTQPHLKYFIEDLLPRIEADAIHVVAHSLGNDAIVRVLAEVTRLSSRIHIRSVVLSAPDIDRDVFVRLASALPTTADGITLYVSATDWALKISKRYNGHPRAGDSATEIVIVPDIDTIDASEVPTDFSGHSYFADSESVIADLYYVIRGVKVPRFKLIRTAATNGEYWRFKK